jgi:DNA-binding NarL/FixJ family response regulator
MLIGIAEDSGIFLEGLRMQLDRLGQQVVIAARTADELLARAARQPIDAAILDVRLPPDLSDEGLRLADRLAASHPKIGILVLSQYAEPAYASRLFENGTARRGYLVKDRVANAHVLWDALQRVCDGESVIDEKLIGDLLAHQRHLSKLDSLTEREESILGYMAEGRSNAGIAAITSLSVKAVEANIARIYPKLDLAGNPDDSRRVLAVLAWLRGAPSRQ